MDGHRYQHRLRRLPLVRVRRFALAIMRLNAVAIRGNPTSVSLLFLRSKFTSLEGIGECELIWD
jgi:hypothetical protein